MKNTKLLSKCLLAALIAAACLAWTNFAVYYWQGEIWHVMHFPKVSVLQGLFGRYDIYTNSMMLYCGSVGQPLMAYFLFCVVRSTRRLAPEMAADKWVQRVFRAVSCALLVWMGILSLFMTKRVYVGPMAQWLKKLPGLSLPTPRNAFVEKMGRQYLWLSIISMVGIVALSVITPILAWARDTFRLSPKAAGRCAGRVGCCVGLAVTISIASAFILNILSRYDREAASAVYSFSRRNASIPSLMLVSLVFAPILEEITFRGVINRSAAKAMPKAMAVVFSSFCFGVWHRNLGQFAYTFAWGLIYGYIALYTGRILETTLIHFLSNLLAVLTASSMSDALLGKQPFWVGIMNKLRSCGFFASAVGLVVMAVAIIGLLWLIKRFCPGDSEKKALTG